MLLAM